MVVRDLPPQPPSEFRVLTVLITPAPSQNPLQFLLEQCRQFQRGSTIRVRPYRSR